MRVVDRKAFLVMPAGTVYAKGIKWSFEGLRIKHECQENDWHYVEPADIAAFDSNERFGLLEDMLSNGTSVPMEELAMRDGCFNEEEIFLVFEPEDVRRLIEMLRPAAEDRR
jgi:hypothetical protein